MTAVKVVGLLSFLGLLVWAYLRPDAAEPDLAGPER